MPATIVIIFLLNNAEKISSLFLLCSANIAANAFPELAQKHEVRE